MLLLNRDQQSLVTLMDDLKLDGMQKAFVNQAENSNVYSTVTFEKRLEELLISQKSYEANKKFNSLIRAAKLKTRIEFNDLSFRAEDGITNEEVLYLAGNSWAVNSISNLIIQGPCGSGKIALCCAIGANLCKAGISVRYYCWDDLVDEILTKSDSPSLFKNFKIKLSKYQVLIIDDVGLSESGIPKIVADTLFNVINKRYGVRATVFSSQIRVEGFKVLFGMESALADGLIDRMLHPAKIITLQGESRRKKKNL